MKIHCSIIMLIFYICNGQFFGFLLSLKILKWKLGMQFNLIIFLQQECRCQNAI